MQNTHIYIYMYISCLLHTSNPNDPGFVLGGGRSKKEIIRALGMYIYIYTHIF